MGTPDRKPVKKPDLKKLVNQLEKVKDKIQDVVSLYIVDQLNAIQQKTIYGIKICNDNFDLDVDWLRWRFQGYDRRYANPETYERCCNTLPELVDLMEFVRNLDEDFSKYEYRPTVSPKVADKKQDPFHLIEFGPYIQCNGYQCMAMEVDIDLDVNGLCESCANKSRRHRRRRRGHVGKVQS